MSSKRSNRRSKCRSRRNQFGKRKMRMRGLFRSPSSANVETDVIVSSSWSPPSSRPQPAQSPRFTYNVEVVIRPRREPTAPQPTTPEPQVTEPAESKPTISTPSLGEQIRRSWNPWWKGNHHRV